MMPHPERTADAEMLTAIFPLEEHLATSSRFPAAHSASERLSLRSNALRATAQMGAPPFQPINCRFFLAAKTKALLHLIDTSLSIGRCTFYRTRLNFESPEFSGSTFSAQAGTIAQENIRRSVLHSSDCAQTSHQAAS